MSKFVHVIPHKAPMEVWHNEDYKASQRLLLTCVIEAKQQNVEIPTFWADGPTRSSSYLWVIGTGFGIKTIKDSIISIAEVSLPNDYTALLCIFNADTQRGFNAQNHPYLFEDLGYQCHVNGIAAGFVIKEDSTEDQLVTSILRGYEHLCSYSSTDRFPRTLIKLSDQIHSNLRITLPCAFCDTSINAESFVFSRKYTGPSHNVEQCFVCETCKSRYECRYTRILTKKICRDCKNTFVYCCCPKCGCNKRKPLKRGHERVRGNCAKCGKCRLHDCHCQFPAQSVHRPNRRLVAFEYEFGKSKNRETNRLAQEDIYSEFGNRKYHRVMTDTSAPLGIECVVGPVRLARARQSIIDIIKFSDDVGLDQQLYKGSFHTHINAIDLDAYDLRRLITVWAKVEEQAMEVYVKRPPNRYCVPFSRFVELEAFIKLAWGSKDAREIRWIFQNFIASNYTKYSVLGLLEARRNQEPGQRLTGIVRNNGLNGKYGAGIHRAINPKGYFEPNFYDPEVDRTNCARLRYTSFNLHSYFYRGTIEFRAKEASLDADELIDWLNFTYGVVRTTARMRDGEVKDIHTLDDLMVKMQKK